MHEKTLFEVVSAKPPATPVVPEAEKQTQQGAVLLSGLVSVFADLLAQQTADAMSRRLPPSESSPSKTAMDALSGDLGQIKQVLAERLPRLAGLDELHMQHSKLLEGFWNQQIQALFLGLVPVLDRIDERLGVLDRIITPDPAIEALIDETARLLKASKAELLALLATQGIEPFLTATTEFSGQFHQAVGFIECDHQSRNGTIAKRLRPGYRTTSNRIVRHELVAVFHYSLAPETSLKGEESHVNSKRGGL